LFDNKQQHLLALIKSFPTGAEEWFCPSCGRRFIITWPPDYKMIILENGDLDASHTGGKGIPGLEVKLSPTDPETTDPGNSDLLNDDLRADDPNLRSWQDWMNDTDFDDRWEE
jgi:hypothetical protein